MLWNTEQYWLKAVRYVETSLEPERQDWERPFWLSLALEFLARAALTKIHPALNADPQGDGLNLLYAFGFELKGQPRSLPIHAVFLRLQKIAPDTLTKPRREFCDFFSNLRNQELHTAELAFDRLPESKWLARFYDVSFALCQQLERSPSELLGKDEAGSAEGLVSALRSEKVGNVKNRISAHKTVFDSKSPTEQESLRQQVAATSRSWLGVRTKAHCPACGSDALLQGSIERVSRPFYDEDRLLQKVVVLAHRLECLVCQLVLSDIDELHIAQVEPHFEYLEETELHEYHEPDDYEEYNNM